MLSGEIVEREMGETVLERLLGDREEARDAAQEVFLKASRPADRARPEGLFFTWLYRIGVNHCLNRLRRRRLRQWFTPIR